MRQRTVYDMGRRDLAEVLVGRRITKIEGDKILLDNGVELTVEDESSCCAWFVGDIEAFDFEDNVVTAVEYGDREPKIGGEDSYALEVFSAHKKIAQVNIEGDATSGYYCHSVTMLVKYGAQQ